MSNDDLKFWIEERIRYADWCDRDAFSTAASMGENQGAREVCQDLLQELKEHPLKATLRDREGLREAMAAYAHKAWSGWMNYLFDKSRMQGLDGCRRWEVVIPSDLVERWRRQVRTKYADLSEEEKDSDRAEADAILAEVEKRL